MLFTLKIVGIYHSCIIIIIILNTVTATIRKVNDRAVQIILFLKIYKSQKQNKPYSLLQMNSNEIAVTCK